MCFFLHVVHSHRLGLLPAVAVVMAVVVPVGRGAAIQDVQRDVARGGAKHQQAALTQGGVVVTAVTEGTLLQTVQRKVKGQVWLVAQVSQSGGWGLTVGWCVLGSEWVTLQSPQTGSAGRGGTASGRPPAGDRATQPGWSRDSGLSLEQPRLPRLQPLPSPLPQRD